MKFLGIDYGKKRVGIAISDEGGKLAFAKGIISNGSDIFLKIKEIIETEKISEIIVGDSLDFSGAQNIISKDIEKFISGLKKEFGLSVHKQKEFLTSIEARRYQKEKHVDASAAALILQRYLDKINNINNKK